MMANKISVSIVEDIPEVRMSVEKYITTSENFVFEKGYSNAEAAVKDAIDNHPDIIIMDINLPGMNGIDCIAEIKKTNSKSQFLIFTVFEDDDKIFDALKAGAMGYLLKKTPKDQLLEALLDLYNGGSPMSTSIARKVIQSFSKVSVSNYENAISKKEREVIELLAKGFLYKEIGDKLGISLNTVKQHLHNIYKKLQVDNKTEAINKYFNRS
jgi:DNA-binding NarL/FixJ family response regulator